MRRKTEKRSLLLTVAIVAGVLVCGLETGAAIGVARRSAAASIPMWKRMRRFATPVEQSAIYTSSLFGVNPGKQHSLSEEDTSEDGLIFRGYDIMPISTPRTRTIAQFPVERLLNFPDSQSTRSRQRAFFEFHPITNTGRAGRRILQNREIGFNYLEPSDSSRSSYENQEQKFNSEPQSSSSALRETWKRATQLFWRKLPSLDDQESYSDYFLSSKRQPPPGFHAIRGKRNSGDRENDYQLPLEWLQEGPPRRFS